MVASFRARVAVWLNFTPDHLDRYKDLEEYRDAKLRIFEHQQARDFAVVNARDQLPKLNASTITFSACPGEANLFLSGQLLLFKRQPVLDMQATNLSGAHNAENLMPPLGVAYALHIPWNQALVS